MDNLESNINEHSYFQTNPNNELFTLEIFPLPPSINTILAIGISKTSIIFETSSNELYRYIYGRKDSLQQAYSFPIQRKTEKEGKQMTSKTIKDSSSSAIFCESSGNHTLIRHCGRMYYFNIKSYKIKELVALKDIFVTAVAWDERNTISISTGSILIGDDNNTLYEYRIDIDIDNNIKDKIGALIKIDSSIWGLYFYNKNYQKDPMRYVIAVTNNKLYQFTGGPFFKDLFKRYSDDPYVLESASKLFPSTTLLAKSSLQLLFNDEDKPLCFGWQSTGGFCTGEFNDNNDIIAKFIVIPYEKINQDGKKEKDCNPVAVSYSQYHIFFLFNDCLTIISKITYNIIQTIYLRETVLDLQYNRYTNTLWLVSFRHLYQINLVEEDKNVWQDYLEKGEYKNASDYCKEKKPQFAKRVCRMTANALFLKQDYLNAAIQYAESDEKFEEVGLKFLVNEQYEPLMTYLYIISEKRIQNTDKTQMCLILTWIIELYLHKISTLKSIDEIAAKSAELVNFMRDKEADLDKNTIYQLLQQYCRVNEFLQFAEIKKDYETVILHYINDKMINEAIEKMKEFACNSTDEQMIDLSHIFTRYIHIFMKYNVESTVNLLKEQKNRIRIDTNKLTSAMINIDINKREKAIPYLRHLISDSKCNDKNIHNLYILFLANSNEEDKNGELIEYLKQHLIKASITFDTEYTLEVFSRIKNNSAQAFVLSMMQKYPEAIKLALSQKEIETAKFIAKSVEDIKIKKMLWLDIFTNQIQIIIPSLQKRDHDLNETQISQSNFQKSLDIIKESEVLKIEDILPHIVNNIRIEEFKEQISNCINDYEDTIQKLKKEVKGYNDTADHIKEDIVKIQKKSIEIRYKHCICAICKCNIKDKNVYLFPCGHMFDIKCLIDTLNNYSKYFDSAKTRKAKIVELKTMINAIEKKKEDNKANTVDANKKESNLLTNLMGLLIEKNQKSEKTSNDDLTRLDEYKVKLSNLLLEECVLCGDMLIESTQFGFKGDKTVWDSLQLSFK